MGDNGTLLENKPIVNPSLKTPDTTKELIGNLVTVFRIIPRETIRQVSARGLSTESNKMGVLEPQLEGIFQDAAKAHGVTVDRTKCIFAFPRDPRKNCGLSYDRKKEAIISMKIDPKDCIVADGEYYTEAGVSLDRYRSREDGIESARSWADTYYERAMSLEQYMSENHKGSRSDLSDFQMPEVLIPSDILPYRIDVVT